MPRLHGKTEPKTLENELKSLFEISGLIQDSPVSEESLEEILKSIGRLVDFRSASLYVISKETGKLDEICSLGRTVDLINFVKFDMGSGISAWVAQKKRPIILNNLRKTQGGSHTKSFLSVPLIFSGEVRGVLNLAHDETESFSQKDAELVSIVSSLLSLIVERIEHARYESEAEAEIRKLEEKLESIEDRIGEMRNIGSPGTLSANLAEKIFNPLSIIAGNAQFLLMTMKNPGSSVLRRLKAIDSEASNLMNLAGRLQTTGEANGAELIMSYEGGKN